jgi:cation diffusion facilitator family transporter
MNTPSHTIKSRVAAISIFASAGMAAAKFVVGVAIGSLALISEALHSSVDVIATVITWLVVRVSDRPADKEHHYGHGKLESISALGVIALLYVLAGGILVESYSRLREGAPPPTISAIPFIVLLIDIAVNFWRARALHRAARDTKSQALAADALHFASDVLGSVAVIIGLALSGLGYAWGDAAAAVAVAVMIALLGLRLARSTVETLVDRAPEGASARATAAIRTVPGVVDVERLRVRMVGSTHFIDAIVQVERRNAATWPAYSSPSSKSRHLEQLHTDKFVNVTGSTKYFLQVKLKNGETAYIEPGAVQLIKPIDKLFQLTHDAAVLEKPNQWAKKVAEVHQPHNVHVIGLALEYMMIRMKNGLVGFIPITALQ